MNDPLLQTLLEADRILSRSKQGLASTNSQETPDQNTGQHPCITTDNSEDSLVKGAPFENSVAESSSAHRENGVSSLPANIVPIDKEEILQNRLTLEQIKEIPKFAQYHSGEPNKVSLEGEYCMYPMPSFPLTPTLLGHRR